MWRLIRICLLLAILAFVALETYVTRIRSTSWERTLRVSVYPINGDGSEAVDRYIAARRGQDFSAVEKFFADEAREYGLKLAKPFDVSWAATLSQRPPMPAPDAGLLSVMLWSLKMRYWAWRTPDPPYGTDIKLFVLYYDPAHVRALSHSFGMSKGLYAVVKAFGEEQMEGSNQVVLAHELLHTLGATDEYDLGTDQPLYPAGFAEPDRKPLYPQAFAEIMGGKIPISPTRVEMPRSLAQAIVGPVTAGQIRWTR